MNRSRRGLLFLLFCLAFLPTALRAQAAAENAQASYPVLAPDQLTGLLDRAQDEELSLTLAVLREHPEMLAGQPESNPYVRLLVGLNNCNNPHIAAVFSNEFVYPRVAAFYQKIAPQILAAVPLTMTFTDDNVVVGKYDQSITGFPVSEVSLRRFTVQGTYNISPCTSFVHNLVERAPLHDSFVEVSSQPVEIWKVPADEQTAERYVDSLPPGITRVVELIVQVEILPDQPGSLYGNSRKFVNPNFSSAPNAEGQFNEPPHQMPVFAGRITQVTARDLRPHGQTLATFDPLSPEYRDRSGHLATATPTRDDVTGVERQGEVYYFNKFYRQAFPYFTYACRFGNQDGCAFEGQMLGFGLRILPDAARARQLMTDSCAAGDNKGCDILGLAYRAGVTVPGDPAKAFQLFTGSCTGNYALGCTDLAESYENGEGVAQDAATAYARYDQACGLDLDLLRVACHGGYTAACKNMGYCYARGSGVNQNLAAAAAYLQNACQLGDHASCTRSSQLGTCVHDARSVTCVSFIVEVQLPAARPAALEQAAKTFFYGKNYQAAFPLSVRLCAAGNQNGCALQGYLYGFGLGTPADPAHGMSLMTASCNAGNSIGCDVLGVAYLKGGPVAADKKQALALFTKSCSGGFAEGCVNEAECYFEGVGTHKNTRTAWQLFDQSCAIGIPDFTAACTDGDSEACNNMGRCYARGAGVPQDLTRAKLFLLQACSLGDPVSCRDVGRMP